MATYYLKGIAKWAKLVDPDLDYDKKSKSWKMDLFLDDASMELFKKSGSQLKVREDKETKAKFITIRRPTQSLMKDKLVDFAAPEVLDNQGGEFPIKAEDRLNGSSVTVRVEVYGSRNGKGTRLEKVQINEYVPYEGNKVEAPEDVVPF